MSNTLDAIRRVVTAFERSDWAEVDVRIGDVRVHLVAGDPERSSLAQTAHAATDTDTGTAGNGSAHTSTAAGITATLADTAGQGAPAGRHGATPASTTADPAPPPAGAHLVLAPSPGIFWRSPEPGTPPFVAVGDRVDATATVCIVEVMKLMNHLKAGVGGEVVAVYGVNGVAVAKGEPLFAIAPSP